MVLVVPFGNDDDLAVDLAKHPDEQFYATDIRRATNDAKVQCQGCCRVARAFNDVDWTWVIKPVRSIYQSASAVSDDHLRTVLPAGGQPGYQTAMVFHRDKPLSAVPFYTKDVKSQRCHSELIGKFANLLGVASTVLEYGRPASM